MACIYSSLLEGECTLWDKENDSLNPEGADEKGFCTAEEDEDASWCQSYEDEDPEEICDECGELLRFLCFRLSNFG